MPTNTDFLLACATHIILNNSKSAKNCCNIMNILTLNDYCNLTSVPKFSFGGYFSSLTMARPMTMFKVIKINNSWNLGHCKGTAPLLLIMQMCDDQGSNKASCKIIHAQVANHFCTQSSTRMITLYYYAKKLWYMSFCHCSNDFQCLWGFKIEIKKLLNFLLFNFCKIQFFKIYYSLCTDLISLVIAKCISCIYVNSNWDPTKIWPLVYGAHPCEKWQFLKEA